MDENSMDENELKSYRGGAIVVMRIVELANIPAVMKIRIFQEVDRQLQLTERLNELNGISR